MFCGVLLIPNASNRRRRSATGLSRLQPTRVGFTNFWKDSNGTRPLFCILPRLRYYVNLTQRQRKSNFSILYLVEAKETKFRFTFERSNLNDLMYAHTPSSRYSSLASQRAYSPGYRVLAFFRTVTHPMLTVCQDGPPDGPRSSASPALPSDAKTFALFLLHPN
ncbi:hypothetical protein V1477_020661 [Vespula maculifrons]|uniref:Uncharacterized protein n=1 Tax=Vespula maculifrons TaxID=7453 RepID=A0ABD2AMK4_VESMC